VLRNNQLKQSKHNMRQICTIFFQRLMLFGSFNCDKLLIVPFVDSSTTFCEAQLLFCVVKLFY